MFVSFSESSLRRCRTVVGVECARHVVPDALHHFETRDRERIIRFIFLPYLRLEHTCGGMTLHVSDA